MADDAKQDRSPGEKRTDWAERRTALAAERTFAAWGRTGLACIGGGLAVTRLLGDLEPRWALRTLALGLMALGAMTLLFGLRTYRKSARDLESSGEHTLSVWWIGAFAAVLTLLAVIGLVLVW